MLDKDNRIPILDPLLLALKSRRVIVALVTLLVGLLTLAIPDLIAVREEILTLLITLALAVIGGYSVEDAARAARQTDPAKTDADLRQLVREVIDGVLDEVNLGG
ncbi:MAG: hypothetical protein RLP44_28045 [Aggregatilineales bacterium]